MSEGGEPDADLRAATIADEALKLISDGQVTQVQLLETERRWLRMGAAPETCKTLILVISARTSSTQLADRMAGAREAIEKGLSLAESFFGGRIQTMHSKIQGLTSHRAPVVMILHGIKTLAPWYDDLSRELENAGFAPEPLDYDRFLAISLLNPWSRRGKIDWLRRNYDRICDRNGVQRPSIIAHSFGTYLVAHAMMTYNLRFERIIFCGSIVDPDFSWKVAFDEGLASAALNDFGKQDFWAKIVAFFVKDAGQAGRYGFKDPDERLVQLCRDYFRHSDYFYRANYRQYWIPFLNNELPRQIVSFPPIGCNKRFWWTLTGLSAATVAVVLIAVRWLWG